MANAGTADEPKSSHGRVLYYAFGAAVLIVALAVAYRIVMTDGNLDVAGGKDGLSVKITQISEAERTIESANEELKAAQQQLADAQKRLAARDAAFSEAEKQLEDKEQRIQQLLQQLEASVRRPNAAELSSARAELRKIQGDGLTPRVIAPAPPADTLSSRVSKIDALQRSLARTQQNLKN